jgi:hypothetical protein
MLNINFNIGNDAFRVRMPFRKMKIEENTKYYPIIYSIVEEKVKHFYVNFK